MKIFLLIIVFISLFAQKPKLFLLNNYSEDKNVTGWYMSEKFDGVRAYWDGKHLISRNGNIFSAPKFFVNNFPDFELDGELWTKRGDFSNIASIVNTKKVTNESRWYELTYNIFEVPNVKGNLATRLLHVKQSKYIKLIKQIKVKNKVHLQEFLKTIEKKGGEGVVVRNGELPYYIGRDNNSLKVKSFLDEECEVVSYNDGKGKYKNKLGSLNCKLKDGRIIKIGSGLDDSQRENPPNISSIITFKYYGLTSKRNPRFPVFLRQRSK